MTASASPALPIVSKERPPPYIHNFFFSFNHRRKEEHPSASAWRKSYHQTSTHVHPHNFFTPPPPSGPSPPRSVVLWTGSYLSVASHVDHTSCIHDILDQRWDAISLFAQLRHTKLHLLLCGGGSFTTREENQMRLKKQMERDQSNY